MPTEKKQKQVEELKDRFARCTIAVATNYTGLGAASMSELRQRLKEKGIEFQVVKNTLAYLAADGAGKPRAKEVIQGPTAVAFGYGDPVDVAKALDDYIKSTRSSLAILGGVMDSHVLTPEQINSLLTLPPKGELMAKLLGQVQSPLVRLVGTLNSPLVGLVRNLNAPLAALASLLQQRVSQMQGAK